MFIQNHLCTVTFGLMYGLYSGAASNQERPLMTRIRYMLLTISQNYFLQNFQFRKTHEIAAAV